MMEELSAVRGELQRAWNEMTPRQRRCFEAIRDRFLTGKWPVDALSSSAPAVSIPSALSFVRVDSGNTLRGRLDVNAAAKTPLWTEKGAALTSGSPSEEAAEKVECFFSPENLIIEMIPDFVLFGIIFSILARLFLSKCAF